MTDPIADMLTRIRNAVLRRHAFVLVPVSKIKLEIARILREEGFIRHYKVVTAEKKSALKIALKYVDGEESVIAGLKRISTPGRRIYVKNDAIPAVCGGLGVAILSTSKGIMTGKQSRKIKVGGELLCHVW